MRSYSSRRPRIAQNLLTSLLLIVYALPVLLVHPSTQSLIGTDEGYYAQMAREMLASGRWLGCTFLGSPWFEKPPLNQWLIATSFHFFGISESSARLPSLVAAVLCVVLTYLIGAQLQVGRRATVAGLILPTMYLWMLYGRQAVQDLILTAFELFGICCLLYAAHPKRKPWAIFWGISIGLGLLTKSTMIVLSATSILPWLIIKNGEHKLLRNSWLYFGVGVGFALFGIWYLVATQVYGQTVFEQLFGLLLKLGKRAFHDVGPLYYLWNIPANTFPWVFFALGGAWVCWKERRSEHFLLVSYPLVFVGLLQLFSTKEAYYAIQLCPFIALLAGIGIDALLVREVRRTGPALAWTSFFLGALGLLLFTASIVFFLFPNLVAGISEYLPLAATLGIGWVLLFLTFRNRRIFQTWQGLWIFCLISAPWMTLILAGWTTELGNNSPEIKAFNQRQLPGLVGEKPVYIAYENNGERVSEFIAQAFYTPHPATPTLSAELIIKNAPKAYWWLSPETQEALKKANFTYRPLSTPVRGWVLAAGE
jgi:4-amino-4-deoxy-L-arabinose transferase-like glycosyltransferase